MQMVIITRAAPGSTTSFSSRLSILTLPPDNHHLAKTVCPLHFRFYKRLRPFLIFRALWLNPLNPSWEEFLPFGRNLEHSANLVYLEQLLQRFVLRFNMV
jgi:hypothetical protein